jgi:ubiquinone/menaquinone biosynthesis C-methylase UbiE
MIVASQQAPFAAAPFDAVATEYDARFTNSFIGKAQRESVWAEMDRVFLPGHRVLEINCGTGVDALHLAARGIQVVACDASTEMIGVARRRLDTSPLRDFVDFRALATEQIDQLEYEGPFDGVLSNFAGLNCMADLGPVARDMARLLRPGGKAILCLFGRFCVLEMLWYSLHGDFRKAFRRFRRDSIAANLAAGHSITVQYPSVSSLRWDFAAQFNLVRWKGVGIAVPPSYLESYAVRFQRLFRLAAMIDPILGCCPGFRAMADHVVVVLERVEV